MPIASNTVNAVAMTVLPDAPIDPATGLRVPTIAVATGGGVSIIKHNGTVVNSLQAYVFRSITISRDKVMYATYSGAHMLVWTDIGALQASFTYNRLVIGYTNISSYLDKLALTQNFVASGSDKTVQLLKLAKPNGNTIANASIAPTYNTGWMTGDIRRCYLSDATVESVSGPELITNGTFDTDVSSWTSTTLGTALAISWNAAGAMNLPYTDGTNFSYASQSFSTVAGRVYRLTFSASVGGVSARVGSAAFGSTYLGTSSVNAGSTGVFYFTAGAATAVVTLYGVANGVTSLVDNVSIREAVYDRSYKAASALITGTLTKAALATGTSLVGYSGWSASNYLREAYSADLDFGTGEWTASAWVTIPTANAAAATILSRAFSSGAYITLGINATNKLTASAYDGTTTRTVTTTAAYNNASWVKARVSYTTDGSLALMVNGREVARTSGTPLLSVSSKYNLMTYTEQLDNGAWTKAGFLAFGSGSVANATTAPDGTVTADKPVAQNNASTSRFLYQSLTFVSGVQYVSFIYAKAAEYSKLAIIEAGSGRFGASFDLVAVTATSLGGTGYVSSSITDVGSGWYLCKVVWSAGSTSHAVGFGGYPTGATVVASGISYAGDGTSGIYLWGADTRLNALAALPYQRVGAAGDIDFGAPLTIGNSYALNAPFPGSIALLKLGATVPTSEQAQFMYEQEKQLFRAGAQSILPDTGAIVDMAYDDATDRWVAVSAANESYWTGLVRNSVTAVPAGSYTKVMAGSGLELVARSTTNPGVDVSIPAYGLREELVKRAEAAARLGKEQVAIDYVGGFTATTTTGSAALTSVANLSYPTSYIGAQISGTGIPAGATIVGVSGTTIYISAAATANGSSVAISFADFKLPAGMEMREVVLGGVVQQEGTTKNFTKLYDGFIETIRFGTAPGVTAWVQIKAQRITLQ